MSISDILEHNIVEFEHRMQNKVMENNKPDALKCDHDLKQRYKALLYMFMTNCHLIYCMTTSNKRRNYDVDLEILQLALMHNKILSYTEW